MHQETRFTDMKQRVAVCLAMYRRGAKANAGCPDPQTGESHDDYMTRCSADHPSADCERAWSMAQGDQQSGDGHMMPHQQHLLSVFNVAQSIPIRREKLNGVEHVVLPLVALVEGTWQCANCSGPNFYPSSEFGKNVQAWNGRPVTYGHPMRGDNYVSAGSPDVWQTERIGTTFNARLEDGKLHMEAWLDPSAVERAGAGELLATAEAGGQVEVSTAAWIDEVPRVGSHNGKSYSVAQANFQPDHLALLKLGDRGACSWEDGCGVRVASAEVSRGTCCDACAKGEPCEGLTNDEAAVVDEIAAAIATLSRHGLDVQFEEDGEMADDPKMGAAAPEATPSKDEPKQLEMPVAEAKPQLPKTERQLAELQAEVEHLKAQLQSKPKANTLDEYLEAAPAEIRDELFRLHKAAAKRKLELVDQIKQAPGCMWAEEELKSKDESELLKLVSLVARTDYSVQPPERRSQLSYAASDDDYAPIAPAPWDKPKTAAS